MDANIQFLAGLALLNLIMGACVVAYLRLFGKPKTKRQVAKYGGVILMLFLVAGIFTIQPFYQSPYKPDQPYSTTKPTNHIPDSYSIYYTNFAGQLSYLWPDDQKYVTIEGSGDMWVQFNFNIPPGISVTSGDTLTVKFYIDHRDSIPILTEWWFRIYVGNQSLYQGENNQMTTLKFNDLASYVHNGVLSITLHGRNEFLGIQGLGWGITIDAVVFYY